MSMKFTPNSSTADADGLLATDVALAKIDGVLDLVDHRARARLGAEKRVELVQIVAGLGRRLEALKVVLVGEAEQHQAAQTAHGASLRSILASTAQVTPSEAASWGYAAKSMAGHDQVKSAALAGEVSIQQARAIDTVLTELPPSLNDHQRAQAEQVLLRKAETLNAKTLATQGRAVLEEVAPEIDAVTDELARLDAQRKRAHAARSFSMVADGHGSILLRGQLPVLEATPLQQLVAAYVESDRRARLREADRLDPLAESRTPDQRRADALIAIANSQVAGLQAAGYLPKPAVGNSPQRNGGHLPKQNAGNPTKQNAEHLPQPASGNQPHHDAGNLKKPANGNLTETTAQNQPQPAAGDHAQSTARNLPQSSAEHRAERPTGNMAEPASGTLTEMADINLPQPITQPRADSTAGNLPIPDPHDTPESTNLSRQGSPLATNQVGRVPLVAGDRPRVSVIMSYQHLTDQAEQAGLLTDGAKITAGELRRLLCDAELVPVVLGSNSEVMDVGRAQRLVTPGIRRALSLRDGGCAFPGCNTPDAACEAHHVDPWWNGGHTSLDNLVLLCPHHHGTIEPSRFFNQTGSPKWKVHIAADGYPEFLPPTRNGTKPQPMRHQRTLHRAHQHSHRERTERPPTRNTRESSSGEEPTRTPDSGVP